jgi:hypothetical protein
MTNELKYRRSLTTLTIAIAVLSMVASAAGLWWPGQNGPESIVSAWGETVALVGQGLYARDSLSLAAQGQASDLVTMVLAAPLLIAALILARRGSLRGQVLLAGILGYFLYTYMSYVFLWMYNPCFLLYAALFGASLWAFILAMLGIGAERLKQRFNPRAPVGFLAGFQFLVAFGIAAMWLGKIAAGLATGTAPAGLEHYTTLVIQGMDLALVIPAAVVSGMALLRRHPLGYLLSSVIIVKGTAMLCCISAMIVNQALRGVPMNPVEAVIFPLFNLGAAAMMTVLLRQVRPEAGGADNPR